MTVKQGEANVCTWSECQHVKCNGCDEKMMSVPLSPFGGPVIPQVESGWPRGCCVTEAQQANLFCEGDDEEEWGPAI